MALGYWVKWLHMDRRQVKMKKSIHFCCRTRIKGHFYVVTKETSGLFFRYLRGLSGDTKTELKTL